MPRTLYLTTRSPFARKVQIVLAEKSLDCSLIAVDLQNKSPEFLALGPVAKVPVLVDGDLVVYDSTVICEYLEDRYPSPPMYGQGWEGRLQSRLWEELGDSLADAAIQSFFGKQRGEDTAKADGQIRRLLDHAEGTLGQMPAQFGVAQASLVSALGYLGFRHGEGWRGTHPGLAGWSEEMHGRGSVGGTRPRG